MKRLSKLFIILLLIMPISVSAHPGRLDGNGCHTCRTNCSKWGLSNGQYHCHRGNTSTKKKAVKKSSNNKIKSIKVNGKSVKVKSSMKYTTTLDSVSIATVLSSNKASVSVPKDVNLKEGNNIVKIAVTAENGKKKTYKLNIYKKSSNTNIKVSVNGTNAVFNDGISEVIKLKSNTKNLDIKYELENKKAKVTLKYDKKIKDGDRVIKFKVTAEDGSTKDYTLNIYKESSNTNISMKVNNIDVKFKKGISEIIKIDNDINNIDIKYELENNKAKIDLDYDKTIDEGDTDIKFNVIAEDNTKKEYILKLHKISSNNNIDLKVNDEQIIFDEQGHGNINFNNDISKIDLNYILENKKASIKLDYNKNIDVGENIVKFTVKAENNDIKEYKLKIYRFSKEEEKIIEFINYMTSNFLFI